MLNFKKHTWIVPFYVHLGEACVTQDTALLAVCRMGCFYSLVFFRLKNVDGTLPKTRQSCSSFTHQNLQQWQYTGQGITALCHITIVDLKWTQVWAAPSPTLLHKNDTFPCKETPHQRPAIC